MKRPFSMFRLFAPFCLLTLAGCALLSSSNREPLTLYAPQVRIDNNPAWPRVDWQLSIAKPSAARLVDSPRINVRPTPDEMQVYRGATWTQPATDMLEDALLRAFEDSGRIDAVARLATGIRADYKLVIDLRRFESDYAGGQRPAATIELNAKLIHNSDQRIAASRTFLITEPAANTDIASVSDAFGIAMSKTASELVGWTLETGQADWQEAATPPGMESRK